MRRFTSRVALLVLVLAGAAVLAGSPAVAAQADDEQVDLRADDTVDTPERQVEIDGQSYAVDGVVAVDPGESFAVEVTGPDRGYLDLRTEDLIEYSRRLNESREYYFDAPRQTGTYAIALEADGLYQELQPVVVQGYDLDVSAPDGSVETGETVTVTVDLQYNASEDSPPSVDVAAHDDGTVVNGTATAAAEDVDGGERYAVDLDFSDAPAGSYDLYAAARSDADVEGFSTALAVDGSASIDVTASDDGSDGDENGTDGEGAENGTDSDGGTGLPAGGDDGSTGGEDADGDGTDDSSDGDGSDGDDSGADDDSTGTDDDSDSESGEDSDAEDPAPGDGDGSEVVEPNDGEDGDDATEDDSTDDETPGFGVLAVLAALLTVAGRAALRSE